jgi:hypothetical protein
MLGQRQIVIDGLVAGKNAAPQKAVTRGVGRELVVTVLVAVADPPLEAVHDIGRLGKHDDAPDLDARPQCEPHARDDAEQAVAADDEPEEIRARGSRAEYTSCRIHEVELPTCCTIGFSSAAPVRVAGERPADAQRSAPVSSDRSPLPPGALLHAIEMLEQPWPLDAALDRDGAALGVERQHAVEVACIDQHAGFAELLASHRMSPADDRHRDPRRPRAHDRRLHVGDGSRLDDLAHRRGVEL